LILSIIYSSTFYFFFNDTATTEIYTLSLHDALPISFTGRSAKIAEPAFFKQIGGGESLATTADWKPPMRCTILVLKSNETLQLSKYRRDGNALVFEQLDGTKGVVDMDLVDWRRTTAR